MLFARNLRLHLFIYAGAALLIAVVIFKLQVIAALKPLIFEVGEIENSQGLLTCIPNLTKISSSQDAAEMIGNFCENYWSKVGFRGFFMHHYASYSSPPLHARNALAQSLIHQYGIAGRLQSLLLIAFGQTLSPTAFASFSLLSVIPLTTIVVTSLAKLKYNLLSACVFIYLAAVYVAGLDMFQFILSPGFSPLRHLPVCLLLVLLIDVPSIQNKQEFNRILAKMPARKIWLFLFALALAGLNSISSNLMILTGLIISLLLFCIAQPFLRRYFLQGRPPRPVVSPLATIAVAVAFMASLQLILLLVQDPTALTGSLGQSNPSKKAWVVFVALFSFSFLYLGRTSRDTRGKRAEAFVTQLCSPLLIIPNLLVLYSFNFWGSPNHMATVWLLISVPLSIIIANVITATHLTPPRNLSVLRLGRFIFGLTSYHSYSMLLLTPPRRSFAPEARQTWILLNIIARFILNCLLPLISIGSVLLWFLQQPKAMLQADKYNLSTLAAQKLTAQAMQCKTKPVTFGAITIESCNIERKTELKSLLQYLRQYMPASPTPNLQHIPVLADSALLAGPAYFNETIIGDSISRDGYQQKKEISSIILQHLKQIDDCTIKLAPLQSVSPIITQNISTLIRSCSINEVSRLRESLLKSGMRSAAMPTVANIPLNQYPFVVFLSPKLADDATATLLSKLFVMWREQGRFLTQGNLRETGVKLYTYFYRVNLRLTFENDPNYEEMEITSKSFVVFRRTNVTQSQ